jgi:hypothetical protein
MKRMHNRGLESEGNQETAVGNTTLGLFAPMLTH